MTAGKEKAAGVTSTERRAAGDNTLHGGAVMGNGSTRVLQKQDAARKPHYTFTPQDIPAELKEVPRWVNWGWRWKADKGKWDKPPLDARTGRDAKWGTAAGWLTFTDALANVNGKSIDGIGFVFTDDDDISGVDLDGCRDPNTGIIAEWAQKIIDNLDTYAEVSPSGCGVKCFARGDFPHNGKKPGYGGPGTAVEMYTSGRYFTVTGAQL